MDIKIKGLPQQCRRMAGLAGVVLLVGCSQPKAHELWITPRPLHAEVDAARGQAPSFPENLREHRPLPVAEPAGPLELAQAVRLALGSSPDLTAAGWEVQASDADAQQAGRPPNPQASFSAENFAGPDAGDTFEAQTLRLSQVLEVRGKREKRMAVASAQQRLAAWDYEQQRLDLAASVTARYIQVVVDQQRIELAKQNLALAQRVKAIVDDRVAAGLVPTAQQDKAAVRVSLQQIALQRAERSLDASRHALVATWGGTTTHFTQATGDLAARIELPGQEELLKQLDQSPAIARWDDEQARRQSALELAKAQATPDPTIGGGVRFFPDRDAAAGVFEVSWPLAVLDRNQSGILAARLRVSQVDELRRAALAEAGLKLAAAYTMLEASAFELKTLEADTVPAADRAYRAATNAFNEGQTDYLDVLDAERTLVEVRMQQLDAALNYHTAVAEIERLTGQAL